MESLLQEVRTSGQAITLFELAATLRVSTIDAQNQLQDFMISSPAMSRDYELFYTASGSSKATGKAVSTIPGLLEEVQRKAEAQLENVKTSIYCVSPKGEQVGQPRMMIRKHRSLSAKGLERGRTYRTMTRDESIKGLQRRQSSGGNNLSQLGLSQLTLGSRQATLAGGSSASPLSTLQPSKSNILPSSSFEVVKKEEQAPASAPVPKVEVKKVEPVKVEEVDEKLVVPPSPQVVEVKESPAKLVSPKVEQIAESKEAPAREIPRKSGEVDAVPEPTTKVEEVKLEEVDAVPPVLQVGQEPVHNEQAPPHPENTKKAASVTVVEEEKENALPTTTITVTVVEEEKAVKKEEAKKPSLLDALMKKPGTEGMLKEKKSSATNTASTATKGKKKKAQQTTEENNMSSLGKKSGNKTTSGDTSGLVDDEDSETNPDSVTNTQQPSAPKTKKEKAAPVKVPEVPAEAPQAKILSVVNDELQLGAFIPVVVNPATFAPSKEKSPSSSSGAATGASPGAAAATTGAKRTRDQNTKAETTATTAAAAAPAVTATHKDIRGFFSTDRLIFSKKWEKQVDQKMEKVGNVWTTMDVVVFKAKDGSGEILSAEEYKEREAKFMETFSPQGAAAGGGVGIGGGVSPGEAGAAAAATTAEEDQEAPSKKKQRAEPAKKSTKASKSEAPGQPRLDMFFKKK